ncbi:hypothetical protein [Desulfonatronospira sp.]|uniref:hypothetical protein n=1 Tax=Desulfonatronospira sp. TaxID=1962951 RepID=UPI0025C702B3|nr:hypothetical protein [Desulfonatronospira sp.]
MRRQSKILIDHQCPQCGAPAVLEETDHLFSCEYCRVKSFLISKDYFRYIIPDSAPGEKDLIYFPYWRFKGCLFSSTPRGIKKRILDISSKSLNSDNFPLSLGLRPQTQRLKFLSPDKKGLFLQPDVSFGDVLGTTTKRFRSSLPGPVFLNSFIGDTISMIYAPFYLQQGEVMDAVLNRVATTAAYGETRLEDYTASDPGWRIKFIPALCPACGWDIDGCRDSLAFTCHNCNSMWLQSKDRFIPLEFATMPYSQNNMLYLPFYRIETDISGLDLKSASDLIRLANLPRMVQDSCRKQKFYFWTPAFKIRPKELLGFATGLTLSQPQEDWHKDPPGQKTHPVTLSASDAAGLTKVVLADFLRPVSLLHNLRQIKIMPRQYLLVYLPFDSRGNELYQQHYRMRLNRNVLNYAAYL